jgi:hypothetical protein
MTTEELRDELTKRGFIDDPTNKHPFTEDPIKKKDGEEGEEEAEESISVRVTERTEPKPTLQAVPIHPDVPSGSFAEAAFIEEVKNRPPTPQIKTGFTAQEASRINLLENLRVAKELLQTKQAQDLTLDGLAKLDDTSPLPFGIFRLFFKDEAELNYWIELNQAGIDVIRKARTTQYPGLTMYCIFKAKPVADPSVPDNTAIHPRVRDPRAPDGRRSQDDVRDDSGYDHSRDPFA